MIIPLKYQKYNLKLNDSIIIYDDEFAEELEDKLKISVLPDENITIDEYINNLNELMTNCDFKKELKSFINNVIEVNDINNWSIVQYEEKIKSNDNNYINNNYYCMIYVKKVNGSFSICIIDENEKVNLCYNYPIDYFKLIEDPLGHLTKYWANKNTT